MRPVIQTFTGLEFDLLNPDPARIRIADIAHALARLCRYTGHIVPEWYSVAEHSCEVAARLGSRLRWAGLIHDAHEAYVGDVSAPLKSVMRAALEPCLDPYTTVVNRVEVAVRAKLGLEPLADLDPEIKRVDLGMLAIEREQIMRPVDWPWIDVPRVARTELRCDAPTWAEGRFLMEACYLAPTVELADEARAAYNDWNEARRRCGS